MTTKEYITRCNCSYERYIERLPHRIDFLLEKENQFNDRKKIYHGYQPSEIPMTLEDYNEKSELGRLILKENNYIDETIYYYKSKPNKHYFFDVSYQIESMYHKIFQIVQQLEKEKKRLNELFERMFDAPILVNAYQPPLRSEPRSSFFEGTIWFDLINGMKDDD